MNKMGILLIALMLISVGFLSGCTENESNEYNESNEKNEPNENNEPNEPESIDSDGDGYTDDVDAFPNDSSEWLDSDNDGVGDNADAFPDDSTETNDSDNDGVGDNGDAFPHNSDEQYDSDNDGVGDNADAFPDDSTETNDSDNDGVGDNGDAFPDDPNEWKDTDGDGIGDNADIYDYGNGGLKVKLTRFEGDGSLDSDGGIIDPQFWIIINEPDIITGEWVEISRSSSSTYYDTIELINPLTAIVDVDDDIEVVGIEIYAFDEIEGGTLFDYIDINGRSSTKEYWSIGTGITSLYLQPRTFSDDGSLDLEDELDGIIEGVYEIIEV